MKNLREDKTRPLVYEIDVDGFLVFIEITNEDIRDLAEQKAIMKVRAFDYYLRRQRGLPPGL